jgi:RimJ/RimL family protein N-acetyltransferase
MGVPDSTRRLVFRPMAADDLDDMAALLGDPEVMRYYPRPKDRAESLAWIDWNLACTGSAGSGCGC